MDSFFGKINMNNLESHVKLTWSYLDNSVLKVGYLPVF
jgi:hypothetical protein